MRNARMKFVTSSTVAIVQLNARFLVEQVGQARLRAFDLGGQQGFFAHGAIEQPFE
jgi:hypothetical protein